MSEIAEYGNLLTPYPAPVRNGYEISVRNGFKPFRTKRYMQDFKSRKLNRLPGYDYSTPGYYFITTNVYQMEHRFGHIENKKMILNRAGEIVQYCWHDLPNHYPNVELDEFIIMPDHFHGIIHIPARNNNHGIPEFMRAFKTFSSRRINEMNPGWPFKWHKSYYDRIVRSEEELNNIREYIKNNPKKWRINNND